jgi:hypothetical protein
MSAGNDSRGCEERLPQQRAFSTSTERQTGGLEAEHRDPPESAETQRRQPSLPGVVAGVWQGALTTLDALAKTTRLSSLTT